MSKRPVQHSFSSVTLFETCPKKFWHLRIRKDVKDSQSSVGEYGQEAHKHFEHRLMKGKRLPMDLQHHEKVLKPLADAPGEGMPEQKLAINRSFEPTGFFDEDVWLRAIIDYVKLKDDRAVIIDHKFGKRKEGFDQIELCTAVFACYRPEVTQYTGAFYWAKEKKFTRTKITPSDIPAIWEKFTARFERVEHAVAHDEFPAKPNGLCKNYCPVKSCPHNGH